MKHFQLEVDAMGLTASLIINPEKKEIDISLEAVLEFLDSKGIKEGIFKNTISRNIESANWGRSFIVAQGKRPVDGDPGKVKFNFSTEKTYVPELNSDGSVNYRALNIIKNVSAGDVLAEILPPKSGEEGVNVYGDPLPPKSPEAKEIISGLNTNYSDETKTKIVAEVDGHVKVKQGNVLEVDTVYQTKKDVDFSTGNITVSGDIEVNGDVRTGFRVEATGNVLVKGTVEDAEIKADGNVVVQGGFVGSGKGVIEATGNVLLHFIDRQTVNAGGDIHIAEEALHSKLTADGDIKINHGKGVLLGGFARAGGGVEIKHFGNELKVKSVVSIAEDAKNLDDLEQYRSKIDQINEKTDLLSIKLSGIINQVYHAGWTPELESRYRLMESTLSDIVHQRYKLTEVLTELENEMVHSAKDSYLRVTRQTYPGTMLRLGGLTKKFDKVVGPAEFTIHDNLIFQRPI